MTVYNLSIFIALLQTDMDSTNVYAYISIIALFVCLPPAIFVSLTYLKTLPIFVVYNLGVMIHFNILYFPYD